MPQRIKLRSVHIENHLGHPEDRQIIGVFANGRKDTIASGTRDEIAEICADIKAGRHSQYFV